MIQAFDRERTPEPVCRCLTDRVARLESGRVDPQALLVRNRTSKPVEAYQQSTRNVAALERAEGAGLDPSPGQDVRYVVVDDDKDSRERVRLEHELGEEYDVEFYRDLLVRAAESATSPLGWGHDEIEEFLADRSNETLSSY